ncbi:MAG: hypothetical protein J2P26_14640 [Nocardiopsaceae bacterium]|nr:hypothetical protein [Nocardiopsaceae bacterium]
MVSAKIRSRIPGRHRVCGHHPPCPPASAPDAAAARAVARHPEQGWTLLCNGLVFFDDSEQPIILADVPAAEARG